VVALDWEVTGVLLDLLTALALGGWLAWCFASPVLLMMRWAGLRDTRLYRLWRGIRMELRPFRYLMVAVIYLPPIFTYGGALGWNGAGLGTCLICCAIDRPDDDDDDRWKRRKKKVADKVAQVGGRLQVVPAGALS
jgi:hypothetical protein